MHHKSIEDVFKELKTDKNGLAEKEAEARLQKYGLNEIQQLKKISPVKIFLNQFNNIVIYILIFALAVSIFLNETIDAIVIGAIVIVNAIIGFIQEYRAEKAIEALKKLASLKATVIREEKEKEIDAKLLVPGDIVKLETGDKIPADCRLIEVTELQTQEATLTGESTPIKKELLVLDEKTPLADRLNMAFSGTIITNGKAHAVVTATGMQTEIGKIAVLIEEIEPELTPLQKKLNTLGKKLGIVVIMISIIVFLAQLFKNPVLLGYLASFEFLEFLKGSREIFLTAIALAVAAIPEGLPVVVTVGLAIGIKRMVKRNALNRHLPSVETLGSTTVICTDKTGTLTKNEMTVTKIYANGKIIDVTGSGYGTKGEFLSNNKKVNPDELKLLLQIGALNNDASFDKENVIGDPTEAALLVSAAKSGLNFEQLRKRYAREDEIPFTSERKIMTTMHDINGSVAYIKGAPEVVLKLCNSIYVNGKARELTENERKRVLQTNSDFAGDALRVLGFAFKAVTDKSRMEKNLTFVGLQAMIDPPREEVKIAIEKCKKAGIKIVVITGDHEITAKAIAKDIGIEGKSITGSHLEKMSEEELDEEVENIVLYARVNPEHKIKIVNALKKKGYVVAMTGDGVNDAPALKKADIGIAMGITGTDVAKEASAMILLDDNFASIVNAVEEGRGVYGNIRKYFGFLISGNIGEVLIIFLSIMFGWPAALTATQILLINLVTDGLPAVALSSDPYEPNAMSRKPRRQTDSIYTGLTAFIIYYPLAMTLVALSVFAYFYFSQGSSLLQAQTATFLTISMFELYQAFACRSTIYPAIKVGLFKNKWLVLAVLSSFAIIASSIFMPPLGKWLDMVPITFMEFLTIIALSSIGAVIIEVSKHLKSRNEQIEY